jgi:hypothetical protein
MLSWRTAFAREQRNTLDLHAVIRSLRDELKQIDAAIAVLEGIQQGTGAVAPAAKPPAKRGRKNMKPDERLEVADRMRRYWEQRRENEVSGAATATTSASKAPR